MTDVDTWTLAHSVTIHHQYQERPGALVDDGSGMRWIDAKPTGLAIALCNCGLNTGWVPRDQLPSAEQLGDGEQHTTLMADDVSEILPAGPGVPRCTATWSTGRHGTTSCWRAADHTERDGYEHHVGETELGYRYQWIGTEPGATPHRVTT